MSKAEEIAALAAFAASLPADSYLAKWLLSVRPIIEADIRGDIFPSVTPAETRALCADLEKQAAAAAADLVARGKREAAQAVAAVERECAAKVARVRERCAGLLRVASSMSSASEAFLRAESQLAAA